MQKITPFLWFNSQAEEAANFYVSIFKNSRIIKTTRNPQGAPGPAGSVMIVQFQIEGQEFIALNGGPKYQFTPAISFSVDCQTQEEVDHLWEKLAEGGRPNKCAWISDKFGVTWQIVPNILPKMLGDKDPAKAARVMQAMLKMSKIDIAELKRAYDEA